MKFYNEAEGNLLSDAVVTNKVSLGLNCHNPTIGRPKSGKDWKKGSSKSNMNQMQVKKTWDKKME